MTTDITELAQRMKAAAEKATPGRIGDRIDGSGSIKYECCGYDGSLVLRTDHKNMEYGFIGDNALADEEFFRACVPDAILALVEALEKAQTKIIELQRKYEIDPRTHEIIDLEERVAELESEVEKWKQESESWEHVAEKQLATAIELESRTVKLPTQIEFDDPLSAYEAIEKCKEALAAAGIKVEAE